MSGFKLVTFDVTETLVNFRVPFSEKYAQVAAQFGVKADPKDLNANFKKQWRYMASSHPNFGQKTGLGWEKWWKELVRMTFQEGVKCNNIDIKVLDSIGNQLIEDYKTSECWQLADGAQELLVHLNKMNIPIGVISNYDERLECVLKAMKIDKHFQFVITSYAAGFEKPDARIFQLALHHSGDKTIGPSNALHVGNKPDVDYIGAIKAGWKAALIYHNIKKVTEQYQEIDPKCVFASLEDLQSFLHSINM